MSRKVVNKGGIGVGAPYDFPGYEYDPVNDSFKDLETGKTFTKNGNAKLETSKSVTVSENGPQIITPSPTYDGMEKVVLDVQVPQGGDIEANKAATIDVSAYTEPVEITPTAGKDGMEKCTVTLSNIPSGGDIEANKAATIDVSAYTEPVEITPTAGKDGMEKCTVTLSNIPSGPSIQLYAWKEDRGAGVAYTFVPNPQANDFAFYHFDLTSKITNDTFSIRNTDGNSYITFDETTFNRDSSLDVVVSEPAFFAINSSSILPAGHKLYLCDGLMLYYLDTNGTDNINTLFHTSDFSPVYAGSMGNIHFFTPYSG